VEVVGADRRHPHRFDVPRVSAPWLSS
jgi:hypothetical protein